MKERKPFDLERALQGAKVVTRDGREVEIVHHFKDEFTTYPITGIALDRQTDRWEDCAWTNEGHFKIKGRATIKSPYDLFMAE